MVKFYRNYEGTMIAEWSCPSCGGIQRVGAGEDTDKFVETLLEAPHMTLCSGCQFSTVRRGIASAMDTTFIPQA